MDKNTKRLSGIPDEISRVKNDIHIAIAISCIPALLIISAIWRMIIPLIETVMTALFLPIIIFFYPMIDSDSLFHSFDDYALIRFSDVVTVVLVSLIIYLIRFCAIILRKKRRYILSIIIQIPVSLIALLLFLVDKYIKCLIFVYIVQLQSK